MMRKDAAELANVFENVKAELPRREAGLDFELVCSVIDEVRLKKLRQMIFGRVESLDIAELDYLKKLFQKGLFNGTDQISPEEKGHIQAGGNGSVGGREGSSPVHAVSGAKRDSGTSRHESVRGSLEDSEPKPKGRKGKAL